MSKLSLAFVAFALAAPIAAHADLYNFIISTQASQSGVPGSTFDASGTLSGTSTGTPSVLNLTGVTGSAQGYTFTGVAPLGLATGFSYDNLLYTGANVTTVDSGGVLLYLQSMSNSAGPSLAHVYDDGQYHVDVFDPGDPGDATKFTIDSFSLSNPSAVPEPSTLALMGTGALAAVGALRRRLAK